MGGIAVPRSLPPVKRCSNAPKIKIEVEVVAIGRTPESQAGQTAKNRCAGSVDPLWKTRSYNGGKIQKSGKKLENPQGKVKAPAYVSGNVR